MKHTSNFKLIDEVTEGVVAWIKHSTSYDKTPGIFKLVKQDGIWKVTVRDLKKKAPLLDQSQKLCVN